MHAPALLIPALKWGIPAAASFVGSMLGGGGDDNDKFDPQLDSLTKSLQGSSATMRATGNALTSMGTESLAPVLQYFQSLVGGDSQALLEATRPQRARVLDQYDTAFQAISQFGGRGGGTNAAMSNARFAQANQLSSITADAQNNAANQLATLAPAITATGLTAQQMASSDLNTVIQAVLARMGLGVQQRGQNMAMAGSAGETLGSIIGAILTRGSGGGGGGGGGGGTA